MPEPVAAHCAGIGACVLTFVFRLVLEHVFGGLLDQLVLFFRLHLGDLGGGAVPVRPCFLLMRGDQLGEHARERIDLMTPELSARCKVRAFLGEHAFETEHQAVLHFPVRGGRPAAALDLGQRVVERAPARRLGRENFGGVFALSDEGLARPGFGSEGVGHQAVRRLRRYGRLLFDLLHGRSD